MRVSTLLLFSHPDGEVGILMMGMMRYKWAGTASHTDRHLCCSVPESVKNKTPAV